MYRLESMYHCIYHISPFYIIGQVLFHFFGISTDGFRIVGGIIIFKIGYDMLQAHFTHVKLNETERKEYSKDIPSHLLPFRCYAVRERFPVE